MTDRYPADRSRSVSPSLLLLALGLASLWPTSSCAPAEQPQGVVHMGDALHVPLQLTRQNTPTDAELRPTIVEHLTPTAEIEPWQVLCKQTQFHPRLPLSRGADAKKEPGLRLDDQEPKQISIPVSIPATSINEIVVLLRTFNRETVQVFLKREGRPVAVSDAVSVASATRALTFSFPKLRQLEGDIDEILIRVDSLTKTMLLFGVIAQHRPISTFLPGPEADLVAIRSNLDDARRGVGLTSENPLVGEIDAQPNTELVFSYGTPEDLRLRPGKGPNGKRTGRSAVIVELTRDGRLLGTHKYPLERSASKKAEWHDASVDLAQYGRGTLSVNFTLKVDSDLEGVCLIGEARVRSRGSAAPTVLLITSDTHRADHIGTAGDLVITPTLDALAARGVVFEDCYSATNVTNPSHVSIMTAVNPRDTRIVNNRSPLVSQAITMAEGFQEGGYRTFAALSAHHLMDDESGLGQGFERMSAPHHADRDSSETLDLLEEWLDMAAGEPIFVWLHVFDAHSPYEPPAPYSGRYYDSGKDPRDPETPLAIDEELIPQFLAGLRDVDFPYTQYRGEVDYLDQQLARILERDRFRNGIVAFTADHGESFGQHGVYWDHAELYPDTVHIPLILSWPGGATGQVVDAPVSVLDVGRTLLNLAGLEDTELAGRDLRAALEDTFEREPRFLISAHGFSSAINSGGWHLILHLREHHQSAISFPRDLHQVELYDLRVDPGCENDLIDKEFERATRMRARLVRWLSEARELNLRGEGTQTREGNAQLAQLGYANAEPVEEGAWFDLEHEDCAWCDRFR
ncbi:MAG: arylsulfatase A-like enzyme [Chlamydiales bacterium]|jgi:arylsulfatase A-like enzyme